MDAGRPLRILHLEDSQPDAELIREALVSAGLSLQMDWAENEPQFTSFLRSGGYDLILADYHLPRFDAPASLRLARSLSPSTPFIAVSGAVGDQEAVELIKEGATDYVLKDRLDKLPLAIKRALDECAKRQALQEAEKALHRLNRELRAISECHQIMVRAENEQSLLDDICRAICDDAGYGMAWVGCAENGGAKIIRPIAWAGTGVGDPDQAIPTWATDELRLCGPSERSLLNGETVCVQDIATGPDGSSWRANALRHGYRSSIMLSLKDESPQPFGVLGIFSTEPNAFNEEEIRLLEELAGDLAFGLTVLRARAGRQKAEREREQFHKFFLASADVMCITDPDGIFLKTNPSCQEILGYSESELISKPLVDFIHPEDRQRTLDEMASQMKRGHALAFENRFLCKDGSFKWLSWRAINDKAEGITYATARDVTLQKRAEEQLRQSQKMEAVGQLAGGVAHDFNNILTAIIGFSNLAKRKMAPADPQLAFIEQVLASADRAAHLTQGLLAFSRKQVLVPRAVDLNAIMKSVESLLRRLIGEDIELVVQLPDETLIMMADAGQIEQVLMNLATNARDAMPRGGRLAITTEAKVLGKDFVNAHGFGNPGRYCLITVSDSGIGMDEATRTKIFDPFFTTKEQGKGTGLGLSIVYGIIKQHDGAINVYSEPGKGTTFRIYLPLIGATVEDNQSEQDADPLGGTETILLAEDDKDVRSLTSTVLRGFGYHVIEAVNGLDALAKYQAQAKEIDLLILDVIMPKMSGRDAYDTLRALNPGLKALFMSGYTADALSTKGLFAEGAYFLPKPMSPTELLRKVRAILDEALSKDRSDPMRAAKGRPQ
jgi:PAS domain S-box-containing protein